MKRIAVLGAGAWGTALAAVLSGRHGVTLWARDAAQAEAIARERRNRRYLPEVELPATLTVTYEFPARGSAPPTHTVSRKARRSRHRAASL